MTSARVVLEVYPHAGLVALFDLPKSLKYKKGPVERRRAGLMELSEYLANLKHAKPPLRGNDRLSGLLDRDIGPIRGRDLKAHEDRLDGLVCAYLGYYFWYGRLTRNKIIGDVETGYIAIPHLVAGGIGATPNKTRILAARGTKRRKSRKLSRRGKIGVQGAAGADR